MPTTGGREDNKYDVVEPPQLTIDTRQSMGPLKAGNDLSFQKPQSPLIPQNVSIHANLGWEFMFDQKKEVKEEELFQKLNNYTNRLPEMELLKLQQAHKKKEQENLYFDQRKAFQRAEDGYKPREMIVQGQTNLKSKFSLAD